MAKKNDEKTSSRVATIASRLLSDDKTPKDIKSVAGSALTQAASRKTGKRRK